MKQTVKIPKSRLEPPVDYGEVISSRRAVDVRLSYNESEFVMFSSDKLVVFDAYSKGHTYAPLDKAFGAVGFPFWLGVMTDCGERVAYAGIRFGEEKIQKWELCFSGKRDDIMQRLASDADAASVPVPSGVCCIADEAAYNKYAAHIGDEDHPLSGLIVLNGQTHTTVKLFDSAYSVFSTGWGDGRYRCFAGLNDAGRIMTLIVDFGMIEYPPWSDGGYVEFEVETENAYVYDHSVSEAENNVRRWTLALNSAADASDRLIAYSRRGYAYHSMNDTENALKDYESAANECKNVKDRGLLLRAWPVYDNAARLYCEKSDYESAIKLMNAALDMRDNFYAGAYFRLIELYQLTKNNDKAMEIAERMIQKRPDDPVANMKYAEVCVANLEYALAAKTYGRLASEFRLYENYFDEASCLIELGDYDKADAELEKHPSREYNEQYWYYKAYIDFKKRRYQEALAEAEKSHSIDAEYMPALYLLIDIESVTQQYHAVARYAEEYKKLRPDKEYGYSVCAEAQLILGNFSECSRNCFYIFDKIKKDDKYAALALITAVKMGDVSRKASILRMLRRKHSDYYYAALYATYVKHHTMRDASLSKAVYRLRADDDFMLHLAVFFTGSGNYVSASHILRVLTLDKNPPFDVVAQQIRLAARINDKKLFDSFFDYYVQNFYGEISENEKSALADRFRADDERVPKTNENALPGRPVLILTTGKQSDGKEPNTEKDGDITTNIDESQ